MSMLTEGTKDRHSSRPWKRFSDVGLVAAFTVILGGGAVWNLFDPEGAHLDYLFLDYPGYVVYPVALAKLTGLAVILSRRSRTLTDMAFTGFLIDLVLAIAAHIAHPDLTRGAIAVVTLLITLGAFYVERRRYSSRVAAVEVRRASYS